MIIYRELSSIETDLGIHAKTLYALSNSLDTHYHTTDIPKKSGGTRRLYVPDEALKRVQRAIAEKLLILEPVSRYATAYKPASGIISNAKPHIGKDKVLKLDIYRFFDSIPYSSVKERAFPKERYSEELRILLSILCYYKDVLPQGAPTSPQISNIILYGFDNAVGEYCRARRISYTRYCDDMTFSGSLGNAEELVLFVEAELKKSGFILNKRKTKLISSSSRQAVTGITVNKKLNTADSYRRAIKQEMHYITKFGTASHLERIKSPLSPSQYLNSLLGRINFVLQVAPGDKKFTEYKSTVIKKLNETKQ